MIDTLGIVEIHGNQTAAFGRQDCNFASRRFGNTSLANWILRRTTECQLLDQVIVVAPDSKGSQALCDSIPQDTPAYVSTHEDALGRAAAAVREFHAKAVVHIPIDSPFIDPTLIDRLIRTAQARPGCDFVGYSGRRGGKLMHTEVGLFGQWCTGSAVLRADKEAKSSVDRERMTNYIVSHPEVFQLRFTPAPAEVDQADLKLAISDSKDWDNAQLIFDALGAEDIDYRNISSLVEQNPKLR